MVTTPSLTVRELLHIHLRTLFRLDSQGRLETTNERRGRPAPRVYVGSGERERIVRTRAGIPELIARSWLACASDAELRAKVAAHGEVASEYRGPAFVLPAVEFSRARAVEVGPALRLHPELLARGWSLDEQGPYLGVVRDGMVVAACYSSRWTPESAAAGVETATAYRGQGLALEAVRAWAAAVQASGRLALYSTEWTNEASRRVAAKLDAFEYGEDWHLS